MPAWGSFFGPNKEPLRHPLQSADVLGTLWQLDVFCAIIVEQYYARPGEDKLHLLREVVGASILDDQDTAFL